MHHGKAPSLLLLQGDSQENSGKNPCAHLPVLRPTSDGPDAPRQSQGDPEQPPFLQLTPANPQINAEATSVRMPYVTPGWAPSVCSAQTSTYSITMHISQS